ncbi:MAG: hypothetical protein EU547_05930 [Promethearchaeota archaeon]|nr:MAG: hypothetical protein EU547_05930 [Candidatus Lokiarchaeota archaeon]
MLKKRKIYVLTIIVISAIIVNSFISVLDYPLQSNRSYYEAPKPSLSIEGASDLIISKVNRSIDINGFGLVNIEDIITIKNDYNNPVSSILIGIPSNIYDDLIYYEAKGKGGNSLLVEDIDIIMNDDKHILAIYFASPLLPQESKSISISHSYKDLLQFQPSGESQKILFTGIVYPLFPYKTEGSIISIVTLPIGSSQINYDDWGEQDLNSITFDIENLPQSYLEPFLENLGEDKVIDISLTHASRTNLEIQKSTREITVSPWGVIKVKENILIRNLGSIDLENFNLKIPKKALNAKTTDHLGEIDGTTVTDLPNNPKSKQINLDLTINRVKMDPNSSFRFTLTYQLNLADYLSFNWLKQSIQIDIITTHSDFLVRDQITKIIIESCLSITDISNLPNEFDESLASSVLVYKSDYISSIEEKEILLTYTIDISEMFLRPLILLLLIAALCSGFILFIKKRKQMGILPTIEKEEIPIKEIREFCSLYEQKNALTLEIREAEEELKRRKLTKKQYRNLVDKNELKLNEIEEEIKPFKKELMDTNQSFESMVKKLDILEAERQTVEDGLKLLESRYKKGKLPSRSAYVKLTNDFLKRRKKIDRTISRFIQQLRSYLL